MKKTIAATAAFIAMSAQAYFIDGNQLLSNMESPTAAERTFAIGLAVGAVDAVQNEIVCVPEKVTAKQISDIARAYLVLNPSVRHKPAAILVVKAVSDIWPCKAKNPTPSGIGAL